LTFDRSKQVYYTFYLHSFQNLLQLLNSHDLALSQISLTNQNGTLKLLISQACGHSLVYKYIPLFPEGSHLKNSNFSQRIFDYFKLGFNIRVKGFNWSRVNLARIWAITEHSDSLSSLIDLLLFRVEEVPIFCPSDFSSLIPEVFYENLRDYNSLPKLLGLYLAKKTFKFIYLGKNPQLSEDRLDEIESKVKRLEYTPLTSLDKSLDILFDSNYSNYSKYLSKFHVKVKPQSRILKDKSILYLSNSRYLNSISDEVLY